VRYAQLDITTLRRSIGSAHDHQRGHVGHAARRHAALRFATQRSSCPTSPLCYRVSLQLWSVANAEYRNGQAPQSCRVALANSAAMPGTLPFVELRHALWVGVPGIAALVLSTVC